MKVSLSCLALAVSVGFLEAAQAATTGTLRFEGLIIPGTCSLTAGDDNRTIKLDPVRVADINADTVGNKEFELTADCDSGVSNVIFQFTGTPAIDPWRFANTGTAKGVALWLYSRIGGSVVTITADSSNNQRTIPAVSQKAVLPLGAAYFKVSSDPVTVGTLVSTVTVNITYN